MNQLRSRAVVVGLRLLLGSLYRVLPPRPQPSLRQLAQKRRPLPRLLPPSLPGAFHGDGSPIATAGVAVLECQGSAPEPQVAADFEPAHFGAAIDGDCGSRVDGGGVPDFDAGVLQSARGLAGRAVMARGWRGLELEGLSAGSQAKDKTPGSSEELREEFSGCLLCFCLWLHLLSDSLSLSLTLSFLLSSIVCVWRPFTLVFTFISLYHGPSFFVSLPSWP